MSRIVETDNFGGDYPDEKFLNLPRMTTEHAQRVADAINADLPLGTPRYWKVVDDSYVLQPGFEP